MNRDEQLAEPIAPQPAARFVAQSSTVTQLPDEVVAPLRPIDFQILQDGESSNDRAGRDLFLGAFVSAVIGGFSLLASIDWDTTFHQVRKWPIILTSLVFAIALASALGAVIHHLKYRSMRAKSAYSMLIKRLEDIFAGRKDGLV